MFALALHRLLTAVVPMNYEIAVWWVIRDCGIGGLLTTPQYNTGGFSLLGFEERKSSNESVPRHSLPNNPEDSSSLSSFVYTVSLESYDDLSIECCVRTISFSCGLDTGHPNSVLERSLSSC